MKTLITAIVCAGWGLASSGCTQEQLRTLFPDEPLLNQPSSNPAAIAAADTPPGIAAATTQPTVPPPQIVEVTFPASGGAGNNRANPEETSNPGYNGGFMGIPGGMGNPGAP